MPYDTAPGALKLPDGALALWRYVATAPSKQFVFPDGCRDLIVSMPTDAAPSCFVTTLAEQVEAPEFAAGHHLVGVRLQAGAQFDERGLLHRLSGHDRFDESDVLSAVGAEVRVDPTVHEVLTWLAEAPRLVTARAGLGLSARSLERLLMSRTGWTPVRWRNLARARRCSQAIFSGEPLAAIAADGGYADQAHMTRDMQHWFGASPTALRRDAQRFEALRHAGYA